MRPIDRVTASAPAARVSPMTAAGATTDDRDRLPGRSLVALATARAVPRGPRPVGTSSVAFLTQLIATKQHFPQTRDRRRVDPDEARAAYRVTWHAAAHAPGRTIALLA